MSKIVIKFGGSNLKDPTGVQKLATIIRNYGKPVIVVVSALYGVTDFLVKQLEIAKTNSDNISAVKDFLMQKNNAVIDYNVVDENIKNEIKAALNIRVNELERYLMGINYIGDVPDFLSDLVLSYGERLSSDLLNRVLKANGIDCEEATPEEMRLMTDGVFTNATVNLGLSEQTVKQRLSDNKTYIVPGFYGISPEGKITLLGRGGTDYSASCIACCLDSEALDVWKDVDGFMSADPKYVKNPVKISRVTYAEAAELAYFGAKILHPQTVEPVKSKNIPIRLFNINKDIQNPVPLTIIDSEEYISENVIKSISFSDDFVVIKINGTGLGLKTGVLGKITNGLSESGININSVITSQIAINLILQSKDAEAAFQKITKLDIVVVHDIEMLNQISLIAVVGNGMTVKYGVASRIFSVLAKHNINIKLSSIGASDVVTYLIVDKCEKNKAIELIHNEFFELSE